MFKIQKWLGLFLFFSLLFVPVIFAAKTSDINGDSRVDASDIKLVLSGWLTTLGNAIDIDGNGKVNSQDLAFVVRDFGKVFSTPQPSPTVPPTSTSEWTQFGHDAQRTNFTSQIVATPWKHLWQWNGSGSDGKTQSGHLSVADLVQPVTGGGRIYMVTTGGVYALNKANGSVVWSNTTLGTLNSAPAYVNELLFVASTNGTLYKLNAVTGSIVSSYSTGSALNYAPLLVENKIYIPSGNNLLAVNTDNMSQVWSYPAGNKLVTSPAFSSTRNIIIINAQDLYVHAVNVTTGTQKWKVKPTVNSYIAGSIEFENSWPVVAENHGIVFVRLRLPWQTWTDKTFPTTNAEIRAYLISKPGDQPLFALNLDSGAQVFIPAVGNGGAGDGGTLSMGPKPVVATVKDANGINEEVVYTTYRNSLACGGGYCDGREDGTMGEMVLDSTTVPGYLPGDVRFVKYQDIQTDEMMNLTMSGDILFHGHWLNNSAEKITNRDDSLGATFTNPIATSHAPFVIWRQCSCPGGVSGSCTSPCNYPGCTSNPTCWSSCVFSSSRYCSQGLYSYGDSRAYPPGFYEYMNDQNSGSSPYTVVSADQVLIKTNDGGLMVLVNGNPAMNIEDSKKLAEIGNNQVLGEQVNDPTVNQLLTIPYKDAGNYINKYVVVSGTIASADNHLPKAIYLGFKNPHDGGMLVRIFNKDLGKFNYDPMTLLGKKVEVEGKITLYWPESVDPEIVVTDPGQIKIVD